VVRMLASYCFELSSSMASIHSWRVRSSRSGLTGTTLSTLSRLLRRWQKLGIVSIRREAVQVRDFAAFTQLTLSE
jgi:hypothetical protein